MTGHERMVADLEAVRTRQLKNAYFGDERLQFARNALTRIPDGENGRQARLLLHQLMGEELLKLGKPEESSEHLKRAYAYFESQYNTLSDSVEKKRLRQELIHTYLLLLGIQI